MNDLNSLLIEGKIIRLKDNGDSFDLIILSHREYKMSNQIEYDDSEVTVIISKCRISNPMLLKLGLKIRIVGRIKTKWINSSLEFCVIAEHIEWKQE